MTSSRRRRRLATTLLVAYALTFIALIGLVGLVGDQFARDSLRDQLGENLEREVKALAGVLPDANLQSWVDDAAGLAVNQRATRAATAATAVATAETIVQSITRGPSVAASPCWLKSSVWRICAEHCRNWA
ncbi:MAG: hypothetical protein GEU79_13540 [Acidimicrobiia bacterium]|nr:hypothetical protein [Acidimicrobiia bacterium]